MRIKDDTTIPRALYALIAPFGNFKLQLPDSFTSRAVPRTLTVKTQLPKAENIIYYYQLDEAVLDQDLDVILTSSNPAHKYIISTWHLQWLTTHTHIYMYLKNAQQISDHENKPSNFNYLQ